MVHQRSTFILTLLMVLVSFLQTDCFISFLPKQQSLFLLQTTNDNQIDVSLDVSSLIEFHLKQHKPLGCIVEESLASVTVSEEDALEGYEKPVFISKIKEGSFADLAGLKVGDVIMKISGMFEEDMEDVSGVGLSRIKSLISGKPKDKLLSIHVLRGTDIKSRHEDALLELCDIDEESADTEFMSDCLSTIYQHEEDIPENADCVDTDMECMLDKVFDVWNDEFPTALTENNIIEDIVEEVKKPKPWARRSSPSGTYVRDPATGKLKNIG